MKNYLLRHLPACQDYKGKAYPARVAVTLICSRGLRWDGGEYANRAEAVKAAEAKIN